MLCIDGIIYLLRPYGGINVYFDELISYLVNYKIPISEIIYTNTSKCLNYNNRKLLFLPNYSKLNWFIVFYSKYLLL